MRALGFEVGLYDIIPSRPTRQKIVVTHDACVIIGVLKSNAFVAIRL